LSHGEVLNWPTREGEPGLRPPREPVELQINTEQRTVVVRFQGRVTAADIQHYAESLRMHPAFNPEFSEIVNLTAVEDLDLQADDFLQLADRVDPFLPTAKRAFVVRSLAQNHAARMHKILRGQTNIQIFSSLKDAEQWVRETRD
jgi:hypothetical protein